MKGRPRRAGDGGTDLGLHKVRAASMKGRPRRAGVFLASLISTLPTIRWRSARFWTSAARASSSS